MEEALLKVQQMLSAQAYENSKASFIYKVISKTQDILDEAEEKRNTKEFAELTGKALFYSDLGYINFN